MAPELSGSMIKYAHRMCVVAKATQASDRWGSLRWHSKCVFAWVVGVLSGWLILFSIHPPQIRAGLCVLGSNVKSPAHTASRTCSSIVQCARRTETAHRAGSRRGVIEGSTGVLNGSVRGQGPTGDKKQAPVCMTVEGRSVSSS